MNGATHVVANALADRALRWLKGALGLEAGQDPFPWQGELLRRFCDGESTSALDIPTGLGKTTTMAVELAPLWWTSRKGLLSSEFRQCSREKFVQIHSRKTLSAA